MNTDAINSSGTAAEFVPVSFEYTHPTAQSVCVAGCFNQWNPDSTRLTRDYGGHWVNVSLLPPGEYEYRLIVDGEWLLDPQNQVSVDNPFGGRNSVITVSRTEEAAHRLDAEKAPIKNQRATKPSKETARRVKR